MAQRSPSSRSTSSQRTSTPSATAADLTLDNGDSGHSVDHDRERLRFQIDTDDGPAVATYSVDGDTMTLLHTVVPRSARGEGMGDALAQAAFDHARSSQLLVDPVCPFMRAWVERNEAYLDLVRTT